jgi:hypothetical protein
VLVSHRNLVTALIEHERIRTTVPKAKELRRVADQMVTLAKRGTLESQRAAAGYVQTGPAVSKLFDVLGPRYMCVWSAILPAVRCQQSHIVGVCVRPCEQGTPWWLHTRDSMWVSPW